MGLLQIKQLNRFSLFGKRFGYGLSHGLCGVPHAVKDNEGAGLRYAAAPVFISIQNIGHMASPDNAVTRRNHLRFHFFYNLPGTCGLFSITHDNICIIFFGFLHCFTEIRIVVKTRVSAVMLSECIIGEKYLFLRAQGYHIIRPVEHRCGDKGEAAFSETQRIVVLYGHIIVRAVVGGEPFYSAGSACNYRCVRAGLHQGRQSAGMIHFHMVGNDIVNP